MSDRDRLIELFSPFADGTYNSSGTIIDGTKVDDVVDSLLANGVIVQKQGKWKIKRDECDFEYMMCSCCKEEFFPEGCVVEITPNFCPNCGAKMKEREGK